MAGVIWSLGSWDRVMGRELIFFDGDVTVLERPSGRIRGWLDECSFHKGKWVRFPDAVYNSAGQAVRCGWEFGFKEGDFEAVQSKVNGDGVRADGSRLWLYVKYVGRKRKKK